MEPDRDRLPVVGVEMDGLLELAGLVIEVGVTDRRELHFDGVPVLSCFARCTASS